MCGSLRTLNLNAEAELVIKTVEDLGEQADKQKSLEMKAGPLAAFVFGPENGAVSHREESRKISGASELQINWPQICCRRRGHNYSNDH